MIRILLAVLLAFSFGCGGGQVILVSGVEVYENVWLKTVDQLDDRAAFELSCPIGQLSYTLLRKHLRYPVEVGVTGCGRRGVYLRPVVGNQISNSWVMNSHSE